MPNDSKFDSGNRLDLDLLDYGTSDVHRKLCFLYSILLSDACKFFSKPFAKYQS